MPHELPPIIESGVIPIPHFSTRMQCFIFRNWEIIEPEILASVLGCDCETVKELAVDMGLPKEPKTLPEWKTKGYITVIRANWHLCSYEQIAMLLGWTVEKLAFILREDDFLSVKLGNSKPALPPLMYKPLTDEEKSHTIRIKRIIDSTYAKMPKSFVKPFDFRPMFKASTVNDEFGTGQARFENRIIYSYCSLYGDTFADRTLLDESFPDELLEAYSSLGINGVWTQAVLYTLSPYPFDEKLSEGYESRLKGMRYLVKKLAKYGIKLFLYLNEPRAMPLSFFDGREELMGHVNEADGYASLCVSTPEVQSYLRNASRFLCENVHGLGGYITITASENRTNCYSHARAGGCNCIRCKDRMPSDVISDTNRCLFEGASAVDPDFRMLAWNWAWFGKEENMICETVNKMPEEVGIMAVSEERVQKDVGGVKTYVVDYSISVEGPGDFARNTWEYAHKKGHKAYAKLQLGNTWELAAIPCIPAFEKIYRHLCRIVNDGNVDGLMLGWTLGGYPSPTLRIAKSFYEKSGKIPSLLDIYSGIFPKGNTEALERAFRMLTDAFDEFPFHLGVAYYAPQQYGTSNPLYTEPTGYSAAMVGNPYDDLDKWRAIYPREVFISQLKKLSSFWHRGTLELEEAVGNTDDPSLASLLLWTRVADCHFESMYDQCIFITERENGIIDKDIAKRESELAERMLLYIAKDPTIGYESSNHYFFTKNALLEKLLNCNYIIEAC